MTFDKVLSCYEDLQAAAKLCIWICCITDSLLLLAGTDDDLPSSQNRGLRGRSFSGNGRASAGPFPYARPHNDLESQVHLVEQEAYTGVLRAFKVQSDALSWVIIRTLKLMATFSVKTACPAADFSWKLILMLVCRKKKVWFLNSGRNWEFLMRNTGSY